MSELKPCPFCGGEAEIVNTSVFWAKCKECGAESPEDGTSGSKSGAKDCWNKRSYEDTIEEKDKVIGELHKQLQSAYDLLLISGWDDDFAADIREITNALSKQSKGE